MAKNALPVLVVGGGIGGFATALALARRNIPAHLFETATEFKEIGAGIQLGPNAFRMFDHLGVLEQMNNWAVLPDNIIFRDALTGEELIRVPAGNSMVKRFGYPYGVIHRADMHNVLIDAVKQQPLVTLSPGTKIVKHEDRGDRVVIESEQGTTYEGRGLVGADGLWSRTREYVTGEGKPRVSGHIAYRAVIPTGEVPQHLQENNVVLYAGPKTHLVHYPLTRGTVYNLVVVFHSSRYEEGWDQYGDPEELKERFRSQQPKVLEFLAMANTWKMWVLCDREPIRNWTKGRVTLLGDAAHPMLQYLAQGANMAMEDGAVLAKHLAGAGDDVNRAFLDYQQERYLRTTRVQITARLYGDLYHAADATADFRKQLLAGRTPEQSYNGMAWLYDGIRV
ncbi:MAG: 3-hydroxybenzoate 6-monooxygenase [Betaproteobacteria bacterium]|nr:3-hydroxybenzoate 6-monooxygenase [Betaproteobacteria bacterium]